MSTDRRFRPIVQRVGAFRPRTTPDPFATLVSSIVHQQVSMAAAAAISKRLAAACRGAASATAILQLGESGLRSAGLSRQKTAYLLDLSQHFECGQLSPERLRALPDDDVIAVVTQIKGVGVWTAHMLLIFCLERLDVWPVGDFGLRKAVQKLVRARELPSPKRMNAVAEPWRGYRTYAAWYLWRSLENPITPGVAV